MKISTNSKKIEELLTRGVENIYPSREFLASRLKSGQPLRLYTGYDPTARTLHIGHGITLMKLRQFQELGHRVIMLIGDFTGMIGDPTDKTSARKQLTREQVMANCREYKKQASAILDFGGSNPVELKYNSEWFDKMSVRDFIDLTANFTVPRLLERDMFQERMKKDETIYLHEFLYPVMQGYDSVVMDVDGEVGGNDQTFNMLAGRTLMKDLKNKEKFVLTMKLLTDTTGKKMGKSEGNMISFSDTPEDMFGKVMSWTDEMISSGFGLCTRVSMSEVEKIKKQMKKGANPRNFKMKLAFEVVKTFVNEKAAIESQEYFIKTFSKKEIPTEIPKIEPTVYDIITALTEAKICASKTQARQVIQQGGVKINDKKIKDITAKVKIGDVVQKGSRWFVKVI